MLEQHHQDWYRNTPQVTYILNILYSICLARQHGKSYQLSRLRNIMGLKRRLDRPGLWSCLPQTSAT